MSPLVPRTGSEARRPRRDAVANRERLLVAALTAVRREGLAVPLAAIAEEAGVGVGTLYRHFRDREALYSALSGRSYEIVLENLAAADAGDGKTAADVIGDYLEATIARRKEILLPLHGGPPVLDERSMELRGRIGRTMEALMRRGQQDGSLRDDLSGADVVMFAALLTQGLTHVPDWETMARRQARLWQGGLGARSGAKLPGRGTPRADVERQMRADT
jgi:AcrR family transcriptional regulator